MLNIIIPLCGHGDVFVNAGFLYPKPLVEIKGKPLVQIAVDNVRPRIEHRFIFVIRKEHADNYAFDEVLKQLEPDCKIVVAPQDTGGPACTVLLGAAGLPANDSVLIANADQYINFDVNDFLFMANESNFDGYILTFSSIHPKWSYVAIDENGYVIQAVEKRPISRNATGGIYFFKLTSYLIDSIINMVKKDVNVKGNYFVCPSYNEMILSGMKIGIYPVETNDMYPLSTPEELLEFETYLKGNNIA